MFPAMSKYMDKNISGESLFSRKSLIKAVDIGGELQKVDVDPVVSQSDDQLFEELLKQASEKFKEREEDACKIEQKRFERILL